jgi:hypothetical protein
MIASKEEDMNSVRYYWPDMGQTVADAVEFTWDVSVCSGSSAIARAICQKSWLTDHDLWDGGERIIAVVINEVESRWSVEAEEDVYFNVYEDRGAG